MTKKFLKDVMEHPGSGRTLPNMRANLRRTGVDVMSDLGERLPPKGWLRLIAERSRPTEWLQKR
jgi:hypothetical protein